MPITRPCAPFLTAILARVEETIAEARTLRPEAELRARIADQSPVLSFRDALGGEFGLIGEIKKKSPSGGAMRRENFERAPEAYRDRPLVKAISVLTNGPDFGMGIEELARVKTIAPGKPVLRKEFIFTEYQVLEARAFGADAILLMASILTVEQLESLSRAAQALGLAVLFEAHTKAEIAMIPATAEIIGINCRKLDSGVSTFRRYVLSKLLKRVGIHKDLSVDREPLGLVRAIPAHARVRVAESGVNPRTVRSVRDEFGYHAALVGNSLLLAADGIEAELDRFAAALRST